MQLRSMAFVLLATSLAWSQTPHHPVLRTTTIVLEPNQVPVLHLAPGFSTSLRLNSDVNAIAVGDPSLFRVEHAEGQPALVFVKPLSTRLAISNVLITVKNGNLISLQLISDPDSTDPIDVLVDLSERANHESERRMRSFLIPETRALGDEQNEQKSESAPGNIRQMKSEPEKENPDPVWQGRELAVAIGASWQRENETHLQFSVFNRTQKQIEILPPQILLVGKNSGKQIKSEPVAISGFRLAARQLGPGEHCEGAVVFRRPSFKQSNEHLELMIARADQVDRPTRLPLDFTPQGNEEHDEARRTER
jgi:hypothetical protein